MTLALVRPPRVARSRVVPRIEAWPAAVALAQRPVGKLALLAVFALGLRLHEMEWWLDATVALAALTAFPAHRRPLLLAATWAWLARHTWFDWRLIEGVAAREGARGLVAGSLFAPSLVASVLAFCALFHLAVLRFGDTRLLRRPVLALLSTYGALLLVAAYAPLGGAARTLLWAFAIVLGRYLWYLGYSLLDRRAGRPRDAVLHLGHSLPFWIGTSTSPTPWPKGAAYLRKTEAKDDEQLAVCQLKAVKLLLWAGILIAVNELLIQLAHGYAGRLPRLLGLRFQLGIPTFEDALARSLGGAPYAWHLGWLALATRFLSSLLDLAIWGHVLIATCRMAGFGVLRNTCRPLSSTTIAEFWNRYYYYFKELLVDFFFYPTYLRCFRGRPRLRLFFATLVAAGFGNMLYHFLRDVHHLARMGPWEALLAFRVYAFYALVLGTAIGVSQLRAKRRRPVAPGATGAWRFHLRRRVLAPAVVLGFYCVLGVFDHPDRTLTLGDRFGFLLTLVGLG